MKDKREKKTACVNGNCEILFDGNLKCDYRDESGKNTICSFMNQSDGRCNNVNAACKPLRKNNTNNNNFFRQRSDETFALNVQKKTSGYKPDILLFKNW